jgi:hypothetical protein
LEEFEEMGLTFRLAMFFTVLLNSLLSAGAFALWVSYTGPKWSAVLHTNIEAFLKPVMEMNAPFQFDANDLILLMPAIAVMSWLAAVYLSVLFERREASSLRPQLATFRLPDAFVWLAIGALLGSFGHFQGHGLQVLSTNVLSVCALLFFFQGIAVVARSLEALRMTVFWQWAFIFLIVVQLAWLVSIIGLVDYWFDFRGRLERRAEQFNRESN